MRRRLEALTLAGVLMCLDVPARAEGTVTRPTQRALKEALALFQAKNYADAIPLLRIAQADHELRAEVVLLLGISLYRTGELQRAEPMLREATRSSDPETQDAARLFLGLLFDELGATDQAQDQLGQTTASQSFGPSAQRLLQQRRPHRILITLLAAPEFDANVPLTDSVTWTKAPLDSADGDMLLLASLGFRPFRIGLSIGNTLSYRQQFRLTEYSFLLNSSWLGYSYASARHRFRISTSVDFALLGGNKLFVDFDARMSERIKVWSQFGIAASYGFRYRSYFASDYQSLSGQTHAGQLDLSWGTTPEPLLINLGYQLVRDQLQAPVAPLSVSDNYQAWAHGPQLRSRAKLHSHVEWALSAQYLLRTFDYVPGPELPSEQGVRRIDHFVSIDTSIIFRFGGRFETFVGGSLITTQSNKAAFTYLKPTAYLGIAAYFGLL